MGEDCLVRAWVGGNRDEINSIFNLLAFEKSGSDTNFHKINKKIITLLILLLFLSGSVSVISLDVVASPLRADGLDYLGDLGSIVSKSSSTELSIITTLPVTTGDDIVLALGTDPNSGLVVSVTDDAGNTYNQIGSTVINSGQIRTYLFVAYDVNSMPLEVQSQLRQPQLLLPTLRLLPCLMDWWIQEGWINLVHPPAPAQSLIQKLQPQPHKRKSC